MRRWTKAASRVRPRAGEQVLNHPLDGLYRHRGSLTQWDQDGVTLTRNGRVNRVTWEHILGVRQFEGRPGYVQLMVMGHIPAQRLCEDHFSIPVNSDSDANRLMITLGWNASGCDLTTDGLV